MGNLLYKGYALAFFILIMFVANNGSNNQFTKGAYVTHIEQHYDFNNKGHLVHTNDTITVTLIGGRNDGQMYSIDTPKNTYNLNDLVEVTINDNGTEMTFDDDYILEVRKVGNR